VARLRTTAYHRSPGGSFAVTSIFRAHTVTHAVAPRDTATALRQQNRMATPLVNTVQRWRDSSATTRGKTPQAKDVRNDAMAAWRRHMRRHSAARYVW